MADLAAPHSGGRRLAKSPDAFRTISEVAEELNVPQHVLRFWETKFSQIKPLKRGGGRRYYRPEDVDLLRRIRSLLYGEGYTIKGVQKVLREGLGRSAAPPPAPEPKTTEVPPPLPPAQVVTMPQRPVSQPSAPAVEAAELDLRQRSALETALADLTEIQALLKSIAG